MGTLLPDGITAVSPVVLVTKGICSESVTQNDAQDFDWLITEQDEWCTRLGHIYLESRIEDFTLINEICAMHWDLHQSSMTPSRAI